MLARVRCRLLVIDSVSAWFWQLRFDEARGAMFERDMTRFVRELADKHRLVVCATKQALFETRGAAHHDALPVYQDYSSADWSKLVRLRVTLAADRESESFVAAVALNSAWRGGAARGAHLSVRHGAFVIDDNGLAFFEHDESDQVATV